MGEFVKRLQREARERFEGDVGCLLRELHRAHTWPQLAEMYGVTRHAFMYHVRRLRIQRDRDPWKALRAKVACLGYGDPVRFFVDEQTRGTSFGRMAKMLGVPRRDVVRFHADVIRESKREEPDRWSL